MPKSETAPATPSFSSVAVAELPAATKTASPEALALGAAIIAAMDADGGGKAAQDGTAYPDRKTATTAAAKMKRAVGAAAKDRSVTTRVFADAAGYHVAILDKPAAEPTRGADLAE